MISFEGVGNFWSHFVVISRFYLFLFESCLLTEVESFVSSVKHVLIILFSSVLLLFLFLRNSTEQSHEERFISAHSS